MTSSLQLKGFPELERGVRTALETYSNVHRGSGHFSLATTRLFEHARDIILNFLGVDRSKYLVIFCTPSRASALEVKLKPGSYFMVSGKDTGLCLGVTAMVVNKKDLPGGAPFQAGGGTAKLIAPEWVIWADAPDRFEAGTPAIINIIAFTKALQMINQNGQRLFDNHPDGELSAKEILYHDDLEEYSGRDLLSRLRQTIIGRGLAVPTMDGEKPFINLDNAASTPTFSPVWEVVCKTWIQPIRVQQEIVKEVRSICSGFLGAPQEEFDLIFTSNTTEAINLAAEKLNQEFSRDAETVILNTLLEHSSNELPWRMYPNFSLIRLGVDDDGIVDLQELETILKKYNQDGIYGNKRIRLLAISGASNVLGTFNKLDEISSLVHRYGARILVDAAQMVAHRKVNMQTSRFDYLVFSAHKAYAPFGTGALVVKKEIPGFDPAETRLIRSSGEENTAGIAALGKAFLLLQRIGLDLIYEEEQALTRYAITGLALIPGLKIFGIRNPVSDRFNLRGGVILFNLKGMMANRLARELALQGGIGVRAGCHCAHLIIKHLLHFTPVLENFQRIIITIFPGINLPGLLRISLGIENTREEIDTLIRVLGNIAGKSRLNSTGNNSVSLKNGVPPLSKAKVKQQMKDFVEIAVAKVYSL